MSDEDRERLDLTRNAIAAGTYQVKSHDITTKLLLSMLEFGDDLLIRQEIDSLADEVAEPQAGEKKI